MKCKHDIQISFVGFCDLERQKRSQQFTCRQTSPWPSRRSVFVLSRASADFKQDWPLLSGICMVVTHTIASISPAKHRPL